MPERIPKGVAIRVPLQAFLASDHVSPATALTIVVTISKNGAAYGNPAAGATNATEIANGSYYADLGTGDTDTAGPLFVRGAVATMDPITVIYDVATFIDQTGDSYARIGVAGAGLTGVTGVTLASGQKVDVDTIKTNPVVNAGTVTFPTNKTLADSAALAAVAGQLPSALTIDGNIKADVLAINGVATAPVTTVKAVQGLTTADTITTYTGNTKQTADVNTLITTVGAAGAGLTALGDTRIANLDAAVSTRLASAGYTAPPSVATILTTAITEAYRANGAAPTLAQFMSEVLAQLGEASIAGTTKTIKKLDHITTAETFTLDSATVPTSITRAT